jgi:hypothetical protein
VNCPRAATLSSTISLFAASAVAQVQPSGFVEYDNLTYIGSRKEERVNGRNQGILQLDLRHQAAPAAEVFGSLEVRTDQADRARDRVFLDEAYINLYIGAFDVRLGKQIYAWGRADVFNPTDNLSSWDYSDILDIEDEKIGVLSARVEYYLGNWTVEGVLVPSFAPSVLPDTNSRWFPDLPDSLPNAGYAGQGDAYLNASHTYGEAVLPDDGIGSTQYAVRVSGSVRGWDFSLSWFDGYNDLPAVHRAILIDSTLTDAEVFIRQEYHRRQVIGADFATSFGRIGVRGEAAYYLTEDWNGVDPAVDDPYLQYAIGLDYTLKNVFADKDISLLLEWIQEVHVPDRGTTYTITDLTHVFRKSLFGKADFDVGEFAKLTFEGVWNTYAGDWWVRPGLDWSVADGVQLRVALDLLGGPNDSFFGSYRDNRRTQVRLKHSF